MRRATQLAGRVVRLYAPLVCTTWDGDPNYVSLGKRGGTIADCIPPRAVQHLETGGLGLLNHTVPSPGLCHWAGHASARIARAVCRGERLMLGVEVGFGIGEQRGCIELGFSSGCHFGRTRNSRDHQHCCGAIAQLSFSLANRVDQSP